MATTIVLVHGAWADGSSWSRVIPLLHAAGHPVQAVQLPLTSLTDDVALTRSTLATITGPVVLVGHSYGGAVISGAGTDNANITGLVYVAAYAPDQGESLLDLNGKYAATAGVQAIRPSYRQDVLILDPAQMPNVFAADVDPVQAQVMAVVQKPIAGACFGEPSGPPAWKTLPSWYLVSDNDQMINPELETWLAARMGATTTHLPSSHASLVAHPQEEVAQAILAAAHTA